MAKNKILNPQLIKDIISKAEGYTSMDNAYTVDAAFNTAANDILGAGSPLWGKYKEKAKGIFLSRPTELRYMKHVIAGAEEAELKHQKVIKAEKMTDVVVELREQYKKANK